jgi:hypothetical protein
MWMLQRLVKQSPAVQSAARREEPSTSIILHYSSQVSIFCPADYDHASNASPILACRVPSYAPFVSI